MEQQYNCVIINAILKASLLGHKIIMISHFMNIFFEFHRTSYYVNNELVLILLQCIFAGFVSIS